MVNVSIIDNFDFMPLVLVVDIRVSNQALRIESIHLVNYEKRTLRFVVSLR